METVIEGAIEDAPRSYSNEELLICSDGTILRLRTPSGEIDVIERGYALSLISVHVDESGDVTHTAVFMTESLKYMIQTDSYWMIGEDELKNV